MTKMMVMCFRTFPALWRRGFVDVRGSVSAPCADACWLEPLSWRHKRTPVTFGVRFMSTSVLLTHRRTATDSRTGFWTGTLHNLQPSTWQPVPPHRGGQGRSGRDLRAALPSRWLCSSNSKNPAESPAGAEQTEASPVPGHGLFKFKELVSAVFLIVGPHLCGEHKAVKK